MDLFLKAVLLSIRETSVLKASAKPGGFGENRSLMGEILFDWLDDVLK
jgi:hypothetical protein